MRRSDEYSLLASLQSSTTIKIQAQDDGEATALLGRTSASKKPPSISQAKRKLFLAIFLTMTVISAALFSMPAPFFPTRAMQKGMPQTVAGLVLGSMQLVQFVAAITFAFLMFHIGPKFMLSVGVFWVSTCAVLFGILDLGPNDASYTTLCFLVRIIQGIGVSAYYISSATMCAVLFNENYAFTVGMLSTSYSVGCLVGPSIGGTLYAVGGYICPFAVMGVLLMSLGPIVIFAIPSDICESAGKTKPGEISSSDVVKGMTSPALFALFYTMIVATLSTIFTETTIGVRLQQFGITDPIIVGLVYLASSGALGFTAPVFGRIADKYDLGWALIFIGTCLAIIGCLIMGPSPILGIEGSLGQLIAGSFIAFTGYSGCITPMTRELQRLAKVNGLDGEHASTFSFISAFCDCCWGLGGFLGAFLSASLMENWGFPLATSIQALILVPSLGMQVLLMIKFGHLKRFCRSKSDNEEIS